MEKVQLFFIKENHFRVISDQVNFMVLDNMYQLTENMLECLETENIMEWVYFIGMMGQFFRDNIQRE